MAKGSGTTRSVGSSSAASGRTFDTGGTMAGYAEVGRHWKQMEDSLSQFASQNDGWRKLNSVTAINTLSDTDNIRTVAIRLAENSNGDMVNLHYKVDVIENLTPAYESRDHEAFQKALSDISGREFNTLREANTFLKTQVKKLNKMQIR